MHAAICNIHQFESPSSSPLRNSQYWSTRIYRRIMGKPPLIPTSKHYLKQFIRQHCYSINIFREHNKVVSLLYQSESSLPILNNGGTTFTTRGFE